MSESRPDSWVVRMHETPGAVVVIDDVQPGGLVESVTIANRGQIDQPLTGWALASLHGLGVYSFPEGTVLRWGQRIRVLSGEEARAAGQGDLVWTRESIWSNRSDTVLLFDDAGREVTRRTYPRPTIREDRVPKRKLLVLERDGYHLEDWSDANPPPNTRELGL